MVPAQVSMPIPRLISQVDQYQEEIAWVRGHVRRLRIARGRCRRCGRRTQGRHLLQTSNAIGAAGSQVGPKVVAIAAQLSKERGIAMGKVSQILTLLGIKITPGGHYQAISRLAIAAEPTCQALVLAVRASQAVSADETGWRAAGHRQWLWVFVGDGGTTVYLIAPGSSNEKAASILGQGFSGVLERDGWAPYRRIEHASHQSCAAHLLRRASEMIDDSVAGQAKIPHALRRLLQDALAVRHRYSDLLTGAEDDVIDGDVIEGTCVEIDQDRPLLKASGQNDHDDHDCACRPPPEIRAGGSDTCPPRYRLRIYQPQGGRAPR